MKRVLSLFVCFVLMVAPVLYTMAEDSAGIVTQTLVSEPVSVSVLIPVDGGHYIANQVPCHETDVGTKNPKY